MDSRNIAASLGKTLPGDSPDEIARWVAERRRNWPSAANVARKRAEQAAAAQSGVIQSRHMSMDNRGRSGRGRGRGKLRGRGRGRTRGKGRWTEERGSMKQEGNVMCDDGVTDTKTRTEEITKPAGTLRSLMGHYEGVSSDEDEDGLDTDGKNRDGGAPLSKPKPTNASAAETPTTLAGGIAKRPRPSRKQANRARARSKKESSEMSKMGPGLLALLLGDEIRAERAILLESFRCLMANIEREEQKEKDNDEEDKEEMKEEENDNDENEDQKNGTMGIRHEVVVKDSENGKSDDGAGIEMEMRGEAEMGTCTGGNTPRALADADATATTRMGAQGETTVGDVPAVWLEDRGGASSQEEGEVVEDRARQGGALACAG